MAKPALVAMIAIAGCAFPGRRTETPAPPRQSPLRDSLLATDLSRVDSLARRGFTAAMQPFFGRDVIYLRPGSHAAYGVEQAVAALAPMAPGVPPFTGWQPTGGGVSRDGLAGYTFGIAVRAMAGPAPVLIERYIAYWTRSRGGPWRIAAYIEISSGPLAAAPGTKPVVVVDTTNRSLRALLHADSAFAEVASVRGPAESARHAMAEDGVLLTTSQLVVGPRAAFDYFASRRSLSLSWVPRDGRVSASGDLGFTIGDALATSAGPTGAAMQQFTKYLAVWRRERDGRWLVMVMGANDRPSPIGE